MPRIFWLESFQWHLTPPFYTHLLKQIQFYNNYTEDLQILLLPVVHYYTLSLRASVKFLKKEATSAPEMLADKWDSSCE